jgi:hypothetical protein
MGRLKGPPKNGTLQRNVVSGAGGALYGRRKEAKGARGPPGEGGMAKVGVNKAKRKIAKRDGRVYQYSARLKTQSSSCLEVVWALRGARGCQSSHAWAFSLVGSDLRKVSKGTG